MEKNFNFTTSFAMVCDAEQFESVRKEMEAMGYQKMYDYNSGYLCTNYNQENYLFGLAPKNDYFQKLSLETFNRDLCLALAAMTDKPDGIVGEWFKGTNGVLVQKKDDTDISSIATKATADELIKHFSEEKPFVLPEKWYCPYENIEQFEMMKNYFKKTWIYLEPDGLHGCSDDTSNNNWHCDFFSGRTKITFDQFMKYVVGQTNKSKPETDPQIKALQKRIEDLEYNVKQLAENMQKAKEPEPQTASRFADKQPLWAWEDGWNTVREGVFWDAKNECAFNQVGIRGGYSYDNYEPIPADQIPAWMIEAAKHLED